MIVGAIPFSVMMILMGISLLKALYRDGLREQSLKTCSPFGVGFLYALEKRTDLNTNVGVGVVMCVSVNAGLHPHLPQKLRSMEPPTQATIYPC